MANKFPPLLYLIDLFSTLLILSFIHSFIHPSINTYMWAFLNDTPSHHPPPQENLGIEVSSLFA